MSDEPARGGAWINPDSRDTLRVVVIVTAILALVSFAVSFAGLVAVAEWAAIPYWLAWALPVFVDGAIVVYTIAMLVFRSRGHSTVFAWAALLTFTAVSVAANAAHAYAEGSPGDWQTWVGAGLAGLAPAGVAVAIHTIAMLTVHPFEERDRESDRTTESEARTIAADQPEFLTRERGESQKRAESVEQDPKSPTANVNDDRNKGARVREEAGDLVARAVALRGKGLSQKAIADELGRGKTTIGRWLREHDQHVGTLRAVP